MRGDASMTIACSLSLSECIFLSLSLWLSRYFAHLMRSEGSIFSLSLFLKSVCWVVVVVCCILFLNRTVHTLAHTCTTSRTQAEPHSSFEKIKPFAPFYILPDHTLWIGFIWQDFHTLFYIPLYGYSVEFWNNYYHANMRIKHINIAQRFEQSYQKL